MVVTACGDDGGGGASPGTSSAGIASPSTTTAGTPDKGGSLVVAEFSAMSGLDPAMISNGSGALGGTALAAIYDTLVRFNPDTKKYEPGTGSFEANADFSTWTLTIKPGIKFSDGTAYDAAAVKFHVERLMGPTSRSGSKGLLIAFIDSMTVTNPTTLTFKLKTPWSGFPAPFTKEVGMVPSPAAVQKGGADFNANPGAAGAGPFTVVSFKPREELALKRNDGYWGPAANLDEIKFRAVGTYDGGLMFESLKANQVQLMLTRDPIATAAAKDQKYNVLDTALPAGSLLNFNSGLVTCTGGQPSAACAGKADGTQASLNNATSQVKVRQAVAYSIDPTVVNARAYQGKAITGPDLFAKDYPYYPGVPGVAYDPAKAKQLVNEAKAAGWDGKLRVVSSAATRELSIAVTAMLEASGISVQLSNDKDVAGFVQVVTVSREYDVAVNWGYELSANPDETLSQLFKTFYKTTARFGYTNPDMDAALDALRLASTDPQRVAAFAKIAEIWNRDMPAAILGPVVSAWVAGPNLHGLKFSTSDLLLLNDAWLAP
jgi:peptide/nickel transport system substrate-binding protein